MRQKNILILVNKYTTITKFRIEVVEAFIKNGYKVVVSVPSHEKTKEIEATGAHVIETEFDKNGMNPIKDLLLFFEYRKLIIRTCADIVLTYTIKPNVYGGMAAASLNVPYIANITGLGKALDGNGIMQKFAILLYRIGFVKVSKVFFQNTENKKFFESRHIGCGSTELIPGSGVNLDRFSPLEYPKDGTVRFAFISRIMKEKGIEQFLEAAKTIREKWGNVEFHVAGFGDEYYENKMKEYHDNGMIVYHGLLEDTRVLLNDIHCVVHPTFYPEGMSNVLLESAASARPIIATDRAGCNEAIQHGVNGYLVKEEDSVDLINKLNEFLCLPYEQKKEMGIRGRKKMEEEFDRNVVVKKYLSATEIALNDVYNNNN